MKFSLLFLRIGWTQTLNFLLFLFRNIRTSLIFFMFCKNPALCGLEHNTAQESSYPQSGHKSSFFASPPHHYLDLQTFATHTQPACPLSTWFPWIPTCWPSTPSMFCLATFSSKTRFVSVYAPTNYIHSLGNKLTLILSSGRAPVIPHALKWFWFPSCKPLFGHFLSNKSLLVKSLCITNASSKPSIMTAQAQNFNSRRQLLLSIS